MENSLIQKTYKSYIIELLTVLGVFISCFVFLLMEMRRVEMKIDIQGARTDQLYELYVQQNKEFNEKWESTRRESDQRFYDLLKEKK